MKSSPEVKVPLVVTHVRHTRDSNAQVAEYRIAPIVAVFGHQCADIAGAIPPYPVTNAWQVLADGLLGVATIVTCILEWSTSPKIVSVEAQLFMSCLAEGEGA